jgi:hypothetical protein
MAFDSRVTDLKSGLGSHLNDTRLFLHHHENWLNLANVWTTGHKRKYYPAIKDG